MRDDSRADLFGRHGQISLLASQLSKSLQYPGDAQLAAAY
jgi:hypothetical protein